jgi:hypothetical protein
MTRTRATDASFPTRFLGGHSKLRSVRAGIQTVFLTTAKLTTCPCATALFDLTMPIGKRILASDESLWEAAIRYAVWGTIGCYFVKPATVQSDTQGATQPEGKPDRQSDDTRTAILKPSAEKLCFPGTLFCSNKPVPQARVHPAVGATTCSRFACRACTAVPAVMPKFPSFRGE